jgi:thiol-disulfide isomerase/thioredoxin
MKGQNHENAKGRKHENEGATLPMSKSGLAALSCKLSLLAAAALVLPGCPKSREAESPAGQRPAKRMPLKQADHEAVGKKLPDLSLTALDDPAKSVTLADLSGKVVLVNIWGPWCPPCRQELPHIAALGRKYRDQPDFQLLAITSAQSPPENLVRLRQETQAFLRDADLDLPTYLDPGGATRRAFGEVGQLRGFPTTFLMDRQGVIRNVWVGYAPSVPEEIDQWTAQLLEEKAG